MGPDNTYLWMLQHSKTVKNLFTKKITVSVTFDQSSLTLLFPGEIGVRLSTERIMKYNSMLQKPVSDGPPTNLNFLAPWSFFCSPGHYQCTKLVPVCRSKQARVAKN